MGAGASYEGVNATMGSDGGPPVAPLDAEARAKMRDPWLLLHNQETVDNIFHSLKVIGRVEPGDRLKTQGTHPRVVACGVYMQPFTRWWASEDRDTNIKFVANTFSDICDLMYGALQFRSEMILKQQQTGRELQDKPMMLIEDLQQQAQLNLRHKKLLLDVNMSKNQRFLDRAESDIAAALVGLKNLQHTYRNDADAVSQLALLKDKLGDNLAQVKATLAILEGAAGHNNAPSYLVNAS
jgi:hypothetical protein